MLLATLGAIGCSRRAWHADYSDKRDDCTAVWHASPFSPASWRTSGNPTTPRPQRYSSCRFRPTRRPRAELSERRALVVTVVDDGGGIASEHLARVAQPFFTTRQNGTGLGLPIARQIAVAHGGSLDVTSQVDRGTTVTVTLPLQQSVI